MSGEDFVQVQLTEFGKKLAGDGLVRVHEGKYEFAFKPGEPQRVTKAFEWLRILKEQHSNGHALFEIVPEAVPHTPTVAEVLAADTTPPSRFITKAKGA